MVTNDIIRNAMTVRLEAVCDRLPPEPQFAPGIRRAPDRGFTLSRADTGLALKNALRYVPPEWHAELAPEFLDELTTRGRIYGYRFRPPGPINGRPLDHTRAAASKAGPSRS